MNVKFRLGFFHFFILHYKIQCNYVFLSNVVVLLFIAGIATVLYSSEVYHQVVHFKMKVLTQFPEIQWLNHVYYEKLRLGVE